MQVTLVVQSGGSAAGRTVPVSGFPFVIGRDEECHLRPASATVSKRHCELKVKSGKVSLCDLNSTNGTFVNDQQIKGEVALKDGDVLKVGPLIFKVVIEPDPKPPPLRTPQQTDEDAAAALLALDEEIAPARLGESDTAENSVPDGSTITEIPGYVPPAVPAKTKLAGKPKAAAAAPDAAKAIIAAMKKRKKE
jgi:pSer/pThr/pTyr-binding forkhead associated (FHA) protein